MPTLADALRGYQPPTTSALADPIKEHFRNLPQTTAQNLANQRQTTDAALQMTPQGIQIGDQSAFNKFMGEVPNVAALTAWHGTPHKIQGAFDISKVGTGASANNFGHGMYFAESPDIAASFMASRKKISNPTEGNLYKVDIPDEQIPQMLDWYKPLAEQTPEVQAAIQKLGDKFRPLDELEASNVTGERLYRRIENSLGKHYGELANPEASKMLNDVGIKGVKYENMQMVRGQGVGTNNYVVFDPTDVKILNKYENNLNRKELIQEQIDKLE
jgi:hypothetical protein